MRNFKKSKEIIIIMFKWFKEKVLGIKPIFKIKIETSWFSERYFCVKFSKNNGWKYEYLIEDKIDINSPCDELTTDIAYFAPYSLESIVKNLDSYEKCVEYNERVYTRIENINNERRSAYETHLSNAKSFINSFNKK